ncbi:MAG: Wzz/FepE/Etk N-terminal domain-containing protein [Anaerolineales bacterium]
MELLQYINIIRKWIWLIILATVLAAGSSLIASLLAVPVYRTTTTLIVSQIIENPNPNSGDIFASQQLAQTYVQLATKEPILNATVRSLGLRQDWTSLRNQVSAFPIQGTQLMAISVIDTVPARAKIIADELTRQLILQSPTTPSAEEQARLAFIRAQLPELERKIQEGNQRVADLDQQIGSATSARQIQDIQDQQNSIQQQINEWQGTYSNLLGSLQTGRLNYITVVEPAEVPSVPVSPKVALNLALAIAVGLTLSVGAVLLLEYLDDTIRSPAEVRTLLNAPILTAIGKLDGSDYPSKLVAEREPRSPLTESYRALRTNLQFSSLDNPVKTIVVTSAGPSEGKSLTASNLAVVLAQAGMSVILVDADLRRPVVHRIFSLKNSIGLTTWLVGQNNEPVAPMLATTAASGGSRWLEPSAIGRGGPLEPFIQNTQVPRLRVITSGSLPPNPAEVLGSARMHQFLEEIQQTADIVVLDSPPCVTVTDAIVLSRWVDGVILVLDQKNTTRQGLMRARENLQAVGAKILGAVINRLDSHNSSGYYAGYYSDYYYHDDGPESKNGKAPTGMRKWLGRGKSSKPKTSSDAA